MKIDIQSRERPMLAYTVNQLVESRLDTGDVCFTITTGSMQPTLTPGDQVTVCRAPTEALRLGDIVLMRIAKTQVAHRLIGWRVVGETKFLVTKGDYSSAADQTWSPVCLCGIVTAVQRGDCRVNLMSAWARSVNGLLALLSRGEWFAYRLHSNLFRRMALKCLRVSLRAGASFVFWVAKEKTA